MREAGQQDGSRIYHRRTTCRACGDARLQPFLDLGHMPLANAFVRTTEEIWKEQHHPLTVCLCAGCGLVQTPDVIAPAVLFHEYVYVSGTSDTIAEHHRAYARAVVERVGLEPSNLVVEVASNDGSLLACFREEGVRTLGVEPASNVAAHARRRGIETLALFFDDKVAQQIRAGHGPARAVVANNVLAHVDDPIAFLAGCRHLVDEGGAVVVEVPYAGDLLDRLEYDTIYHEHLCYFSVAALVRLATEAGLAVTRVERLPVHGGSLRMYAEPKTRDRGHAQSVLDWVDGEKRSGLIDLDRWKRFAADVESNRTELVALLSSLKAGGARVAAYGAPAKGNTLLNWCKIGPQLVEYTVDKNPLKVGSLTPGMHLPVLPVEALLERRPTHVLVLAWNFLDEVRAQQHEYEKQGGRFIVPIPRPEVLD